MISKQKIALIAVIVLILAYTSVNNIVNFIPESKNYSTYTLALRQYNHNDYTDAYYTFGKVSKFSKLKSAALFRQALCAEKSGDEKAEVNKLREVIWGYPSSSLALKAKYLRAQHSYEHKNLRKAKKEFKEIFNHYGKTDYGIAAQYYLGAIEVDRAEKMRNKEKQYKTQTKAIPYFKAYLNYAPSGRFAIKSINKWTSLHRKLNNEDNLLIAKVYLANGQYKDALKYLKYTNLSISWPYLVQDTYALKDYTKVKYYTVLGLKGKASEDVLINENLDENKENENIYKAIDLYLKVSENPKLSISYLLSIAKKSKGYDYLLFKDCNNLPVNQQTACYNTLYYKYPNGQFSAESLANIFYDKVKTQKYFLAEKIGKKHLSTYKNSNSTPKVLFWMAKVSERTKNYEDARKYYRKLMKEFPDDYYSFHAFLNMNKLRRFSIMELNQKPIEFPYKNSDYGLATQLATVKDYGLINQLYKDDGFIQSWLDFLQGDFANSARIARDSMEKLPYKPDKNDARWRLVYPIHYYNEIKLRANSWKNDPILILAIIREESYFNPKAQSPVGARGLMQLMPSTALEAANSIGLCIADNNILFDPDINIRLGNIYYSNLKKRLLGKDILAVLAYNGGIGSVSYWKENLNYLDADDFIEQIPYPETQNYLKKVYRSYWNYLRIYDGIRF